jgi:hypothetical protein
MYFNLALARHCMTSCTSKPSRLAKMTAMSSGCVIDQVVSVFQVVTKY